MKIELIINTPYEKKGIIKNVAESTAYYLIKSGQAKEKKERKKKSIEV